MYEYMSSGIGVQRNYKNLKNLDEKEKFDYEKLMFNQGLIVDKNATWFQALDKIPYGKVMYIRQLMKRGINIWQKPQIEISTIHGAKGGEADNVVLLLDLSRKSEEALINNPDDEHRVFYVGATCAKKELWLVRSVSRQRIFGGDMMRLVYVDGKLKLSLIEEEMKAIKRLGHNL